MDHQVRVALGFLADFFKLFGGINHIMINSEHPIGIADGIAAFDRMHEIGLHPRELPPHDRDFLRRSRVKMTHSAFVKISHDLRMRIAFHRIQDVSREHFDKALRCFSKNIGSKAIHRIGRLEFLNNIERRIEMTWHNILHRLPISGAQTRTAAGLAFELG